MAIYVSIGSTASAFERGGVPELEPLAARIAALLTKDGITVNHIPGSLLIRVDSVGTPNNTASEAPAPATNSLIQREAAHRIHSSMVSEAAEWDELSAHDEQVRVARALDAFCTAGEGPRLILDRPHSISFQSQMRRMRAALKAADTPSPQNAFEALREVYAALSATQTVVDELSEYVSRRARELNVPKGE